jgi:hypothetical protein
MILDAAGFAVGCRRSDGESRISDVRGRMLEVDGRRLEDGGRSVEKDKDNEERIKKVGGDETVRVGTKKRGRFWRSRFELNKAKRKDGGLGIVRPT